MINFPVDSFKFQDGDLIYGLSKNRLESLNNSSFLDRARQLRDGMSKGPVHALTADLFPVVYGDRFGPINRGLSAEKTYNPLNYINSLAEGRCMREDQRGERSQCEREGVGEAPFRREDRKYLPKDYESVWNFFHDTKMGSKNVYSSKQRCFETDLAYIFSERKNLSNCLAHAERCSELKRKIRPSFFDNFFEPVFKKTIRAMLRPNVVAELERLGNVEDVIAFDKNDPFGTSLEDKIQHDSWRNKCKGILVWAATNSRKVHFILDGIDFKKVVGKAVRSITGSELRMLYRNKDNPDLMDCIRFYLNGLPANAPWEGNLALWANYKPKYTPKNFLELMERGRGGEVKVILH